MTRHETSSPERQDVSQYGFVSSRGKGREAKGTGKNKGKETKGTGTFGVPNVPVPFVFHLT